MVVYTKEFLSGSTYGRPIKVVATGTAGTLIHTAHATAKDELTLYAINTSVLDRVLTIEFGGATNPDDHIIITVKKDVGLTLVVPACILSNSSVVRAFASAANVINIVGFINRIV